MREERRQGIVPVPAAILCALACAFGACTVEDAVARRPDAGIADTGPEASLGGSAGSAGQGGSPAGGSAGDSGVGGAGAADSGEGEAGSDSGEDSGGAAGTGGEAGAAGCGPGEVECSVPGAPACWGAGTDCSSLTECKGSWAACSEDFMPHCGDVRGFACCAEQLPVFCDLAGPPLGCWEPGTDCTTIVECLGEWHGCSAGFEYVCGEGCQAQ